jgi:RimJ/RimL family protein N-acetyltransferase/methionyl-tRNA formyltransferase
MTIDHTLDDGVIQLRCLRPSDVGDRYLQWLRDPVVNQYLEVRHDPPKDVCELARFVEATNAREDSFLFGIFIKDGTHIGNIRLGCINRHNRRADLGLLIGDREHWGKGYATRAIRIVAKFAFTELQLVRLTAGMHAPNQGSFRAFLKAGFVHDGTAKDYWQSGGHSVDQLWLGLTKEQYAPEVALVRLGEISSVVMIGGGSLLRATMDMARSRGIRTGAILAPRHADERLAGGRSLRADLDVNRFPCVVAKTALEVDPLQLGADFGSALALCFGPAWIFPDEVRRRFPRGMYNFNGIPIPRYLGGAHYTWQILNGDRHGACHIQEITDAVDRGALLMSHTFDLSADAVTPEDYFRENEEKGREFLGRFLDRLFDCDGFAPRQFADLDAHRLYFPRLLTKENGWIDWSWSGADIAAFCRAFGPPYVGASSTLNERRIYLQRVRLLPESTASHPFCSGLIVRRLKDSFYVAVAGGLLQIEQYQWDDGSPSVPRIREGDRLVTNGATLERARSFRPQISADGNLIATL